MKNLYKKVEPLFVFTMVLLGMLIQRAEGAATSILTIANPTTAVGAANVCQSATKVPIHSFNISANGSSGSGTLTNFKFTTTGTYATSDIVNFKIWANTSNSLASATLLGTNSTPAAASTMTFPVAFSRIINAGSTHYFWITMDISATAVNGNTITVSGSTGSTDMTSNKTNQGTSNASGTQTINALPAITVQPVSPAAICSGGATSAISLTATGGGLTYQWRYNSGSWNSVTNNTPAGSSYAGGTGTSLTVSGITGAGTYQYRCVVSGTCTPAATSSTITVTVNAQSITTGIVSTPFCAGSQVSVPYTVNCGPLTGGNIFTAELSTSAGVFPGTNIGTLTSTISGTISANIPTNSTPTSNYRIQVKSSTPSLTSLNSNGSLTIGAGLTTGAITGSPFCKGQGVKVSYSIGTCSFSTGNVFIAQLSDAAGSFASPTNMGTFTSSTSSGSFMATIPMNATAGAGYRIRVISTNPSITGSNNGVNITVN